MSLEQLPIIQAFADYIKHAEIDDFFWFVAIAGISSLACWFYSFRNTARARVIEDVPTSKIRSAAQGYVELIGHANLMDGLPIIAPLTKTACCWFKYSIEERRRSGKSTKWVTIDSGVSDGLFLIEDETGACVIDPESAEVTVDDKSTWYGNSRTPAPAKLKSGVMSMLIGGRFRYSEQRLLEHQPLYAIGQFKTVGSGETRASLQDEVRDLILKWKKDKKMLKKFDTNQDGQIDAEEWEQLRKAAHQEIVKSRVERSTYPETHVLCLPRDTGQPYLLSTHDPDNLVKRYRWLGRGLLVLGIILGAFTLFAIKIRI